ncbi:hypothetical protein EYZ11_005059 [Aspergillus tanneri]|uniref:Casein kinase substrate phosphoprotein PP28 domain-containing protein n=1 Tax=Aspergillus tanneri TaxID=1220188 RepID=A0A4S3JJJ4_9EURO|nr:hypothetical protein EYZ11_005059 [Aspergillus tanneri]
MVREVPPAAFRKSRSNQQRSLGLSSWIPVAFPSPVSQTILTSLFTPWHPVAVASFLNRPEEVCETAAISLNQLGIESTETLMDVSDAGGKRFSRDVQPVDKDGNPVGLWRETDDDGLDLSSSSALSEVGESGSDEQSPDVNAKPGPSSAEAPEMTRDERRAAAKAKKQAAIAKRQQVQPGDLPPSYSESDADDDDDADLPANPNHTASSRSQLDGTQPETMTTKDPSQLSRREREAIEAQQARERYMKLHAEGKTEEARSDLARLALIRERREADRLRKEAEKEEKAELAKQRAAERDAKLQKGGKKKAAPKKK